MPPAAVDREDVRARIAACWDELKATGVRSIRLFGSAARDELRPGSDVDVLIEFDGPVRLRPFMAARRLLEQALGRRVDLMTPSALGPRLAARIAGDLVDAA